MFGFPPVFRLKRWHKCWACELTQRGESRDVSGIPDPNNGDAKRPRPRWDAVRRELWCGETLIKRFRRAAPNQERVLIAFEEAGWPEAIDDPLPQEDGVLASERLWQTIKQLNRTIKPPLIHFGGDGTGTRVCWRPTSHPG